MSTYAQQVDGGNGHAIILNKKGDVYTMGRNNYGQLGDSTFVNCAEQVKVIGLPKIKTISRGYDHSLAIDSNGYIWAWGRNNYGQLGTVLPNDWNYPQKLAGKRCFIAVEGGHWHTVALQDNGEVWAWGHNFYGELGNKTREHSQYPKAVLKKNGKRLSNIVEIVSVGYHTLALDKNGIIYSWGSNDYGELGHFNSVIQDYVAPIKGLSGIKFVAVGWHHSVALNKSGHVWGWNKYGMLGTNDTLSNKYPRQLKDLKNICTIAGGCFQSLVVDDKGVIWTMGDNGFGQLGQGDHKIQYVPKKIRFTDKKSGIQQTINNLKIKRALKYLLFSLSILLNIFLFLRLRKMSSQ